MKPYLNSTKISLMLADVDGSLVTQNKVVTPRARAAIADLRAAHIGFTIAHEKLAQTKLILLKSIHALHI